MKSLFGHIVLLLLIINGCNSASKSTKTSEIKEIILDITENYFLYEVNVPEKCYTRFDNIEQGNNLIYFDSLLKKNDIRFFYKKGVFFYDYQPVIDKLINERQRGLAQNKESIQKFSKAISSFFDKEDSLYLETLVYDKSEILTFKKVYMKFSFYNIGKLPQLVPDLKKYTCCYSNSREIIQSYFVVDIIDFKIY